MNILNYADVTPLNMSFDRLKDRPRILAFIDSFKKCTYEYFDMRNGNGIGLGAPQKRLMSGWGFPVIGGVKQKLGRGESWRDVQARLKKSDEEQAASKAQDRVELLATYKVRAADKIEAEDEEEAKRNANLPPLTQGKSVPRMKVKQKVNEWF